MTMKLVGCILFFVVMFGVFCGYADTSKLDTEISKLNRTLKERQSEKNKLSKQIDKLAEKITKEKRKSRGEAVFQGRSNRKLDSMLRESQRLVSRLESISRQIAEIESQLRQKYSKAIATMVRQLEKESNEKKKTSMLKQLLKYMGTSEKLKEPIKFEMPKINLEIHEDDTPLEIREKAHFLSDQTALLKAKTFQINAHIDALAKEKSLRDKVKGFADEIRFFDDILFVEEKKVELLDETGEVNPTKELDTFNGETETRLEASEPKETQTLTILQKEASESPLSDLVLSSGSVDKQINLLQQQKLQLGKQIQQLSQKAQSFYKRAAELSSSNPQSSKKSLEH